MCESLQAKVSIPTGVINASGIFFNERGQLCLRNGNSYTGFRVTRDTFFLEYVASKPVTIGSGGLEGFVSGIVYCSDAYPGGINVEY